MIQMKSARTVFLPLFATALFFVPNPRVAFAQQDNPNSLNDPRGGVRSDPNGLNDPRGGVRSTPNTLTDTRGGVRSGTGQPLQITVLLAGKPWAKAAITISKSDGTVVLKGYTGAGGVFTSYSALDADDYIITASTAHWSGTGNLSLKKSKDKASVKIRMSKKPAAN